MEGVEHKEPVVVDQPAIEESSLSRSSSTVVASSVAYDVECIDVRLVSLTSKKRLSTSMALVVSVTMTLLIMVVRPSLV